MKLKVSAYHIPAFLYRRGFIVFTLPLQAVLLKNTSILFSAYVYLADVVFMAGIIIFAYIHYKSIHISSANHTLSVTKGAVLKKHTLLPYNRIKKLSLTQGPIQKLLGVCSLTIHYSQHKTDVYIKGDSIFFAQKLPCKDCKPPHFSAKNNILSVILLSLGFYNAFTGAITLIPFLRKLHILTSASSNSRPSLFPNFVYTKLPALLFYLSLFILALWSMGIVLGLLRYAGLTLKIDSDSIRTYRGVVIRRTAYIPKKDIYAVVFKQNLLFILLNLYMGEFVTSCNKKDARTTFLCAGKKNTCMQVLNHLGLPYKNDPHTINLKPVSLFGYTYLPMGLLFLISLLLIAADYLYSYTSYLRIGLFVVLWLVGWFLFRLCVFSRCFASINQQDVVIGHYRGLTFSVAYIPKEKVRRIKVTETLIQRLKGTCSLRIYIKGQRTSFFVKHTEKEKTAEFLSKLCGRV